MTTFDLSINELAKIEGKATLHVHVEDGVLQKVEFSISEYKRFYTQAIIGADALGLPQLTARICGTCSNAHLLCSIKAVEHALGFTPSEQTMKLRELLNWGLNIRDHALHLYMFCLPDVIGVDNILDIPDEDTEKMQLLHDCFAVKSVGNNLAKIVGGRSVHAPYPMVGGFAMLPKQEDLQGLLQSLESIRPAVVRLIKIFYDYHPVLERDIAFAALVDNRLSFLGGEIKTTDGSSFPEEEYSSHLKHVEIPYSHASGYTFQDKVYMVGALARINLAKDALHQQTKHDCEPYLSRFPSKNIYDNNLAQAIEILHAIDSSHELISGFTIQPERPTQLERKASEGKAVIEAPRGTLFYRIALDETGKVVNGDIIVPTGQNQIGIEHAIRDYLTPRLTEDKDKLTHDCEEIIRTYDPCMSCASHFLTVNWK